MGKSGPSLFGWTVTFFTSEHRWKSNSLQGRQTHLISCFCSLLTSGRQSTFPPLPLYFWSFFPSLSLNKNEGGMDEHLTSQNLVQSGRAFVNDQSIPKSEKKLKAIRTNLSQSSHFPKLTDFQTSPPKDLVLCTCVKACVKMPYMALEV